MSGRNPRTYRAQGDPNTSGSEKCGGQIPETFAPRWWGCFCLTKYNDVQIYRSTDEERRAGILLAQTNSLHLGLLPAAAVSPRLVSAVHAACTGHSALLIIAGCRARQSIVGLSGGGNCDAKSGRNLGGVAEHRRVSRTSCPRAPCCSDTFRAAIVQLFCQLVLCSFGQARSYFRPLVPCHPCFEMVVGLAQERHQGVRMCIENQHDGV